MSSTPTAGGRLPGPAACRAGAVWAAERVDVAAEELGGARLDRRYGVGPLRAVGDLGVPGETGEREAFRAEVGEHLGAAGEDFDVLGGGRRAGARAAAGAAAGEAR